MCGRYSLVQPVEALAGHFGVQAEADLYQPNDNASPTQRLPVITDAEPHLLQYFRWGLVPFWAKDLKIGASLINARCETIAEKPAFRAAARQRRCLVPANAFFEWQAVQPKQKQKFRIGLQHAPLFAFAGLWERWQGPEGQAVLSFTILTTAPNEALRPIHDRMPVILPPGREREWLLHGTPPQAFCAPLPSEQMHLAPA